MESRDGYIRRKPPAPAMQGPFTSEQQSRRQCYGTTPGFAGGVKFYGLNKTWTACQLCYNNGCAPRGASEIPVPPGVQVCCDVLNDRSAFTTINGPFELTVIDQDGNHYAKLTAAAAEASGHTLPRDAGVGVYALPTCSHYGFRVTDTLKIPGRRFVLSSVTVGNKPVVINGGDTLFYNGATEKIQAFQTGSDESFLFYSPSLHEKMERAIPDGTNVIRVTVQAYVEKRSRAEDDRTRSLDDCPPPTLLRSAASYRSLCSISGGNTISGGNFVGHVATKPLTKEYEKSGEPLYFMIQLVNTQSDAEKYEDNVSYENYELQKSIDTELQVAKRNHDEAESLKRKARECEERANELQKKMRPTKPSPQPPSSSLLLNVD